MSMRVFNGLDGVSMRMTATRPFFIAASAASRTAASSTPSAKPVAEMFMPAKVLLSSVSVPP